MFDCKRPFHFSIVTLFLLMSFSEGKRYKIRIHENAVVCKVDERFLSIAIGAYHARQRFDSIDFTSQKLKNVISALRPAYLRLGGSDSNFLIFRPGARLVQPTPVTTQTTPTKTPTTTLPSTTAKPTTTSATTTSTTSTPEKTTTEIPSTTEATTTTEPPTTERTTTTLKRTTQVITQAPTTAQPKLTTPMPTNAPVTMTTPPVVSVTTPPQSQLPNVNVDVPPQNGLPPWGVSARLDKSNDKDDQESADRDKDDSKSDNKEYQKDGKYFVEDIKRLAEREPENSPPYDSVSLLQASPDQSTQTVESAGSQPTAYSSSQGSVVSDDHSLEDKESGPISSYAQEGQYQNSSANLGNSGTSSDESKYPDQPLQNDTTTSSAKSQEVQQSAATLSLATTSATAELHSDSVYQEENGNSAKRSPMKTKQRDHLSHSNETIFAVKRSRHERFPFWFAAEDFDRLAHFTHDTGLKLIFDLNGFFRRPDGSWDATNAIDLVRHVKDEGYEIAWELGNEPNRYGKYGRERILSALQVAQDTVRVRSLLMRNEHYGSILLGPGLSRPGTGDGDQFLKDFLNAAAWAIDAVTWHQYYLSRRAKLVDFVNPQTLDSFKKQVKRINRIVKKTHTGKPVWLGETGSAWGGGAPGISNTFAASFMFLDKLGLASLYCNQVLIRQSIIGGSYALLDSDFTPRPDYWVALLHKKLVGRKVFSVSGGDKRVRLYAHCTKARAGYPEGAVTVMALNIWKKTTAKLEINGLLGKQAVDEYLVTSSNGKLTSKSVDLNGEELHLSSGEYVPKLHPVQGKWPLKLPPLSYAFYVIPLANLRQCM